MFPDSDTFIVTSALPPVDLSSSMGPWIHLSLGTFSKSLSAEPKCQGKEFVSPEPEGPSSIFHTLSITAC